MKFYFGVLFVVVLCLSSTGALKSMGPVGNIIIYSIKDCDTKPAGNEVSLHAESRNMDDKGTKSLYAELTTRIPIDPTVDYEIELRKQEGGSWKLLFTYKGKVCVDLPKHIGKIWDKLRNEATPPLGECPIKTGTYKLNNFQVSSKDLKIPAIFYGRLLVTIYVKKTAKMLACVMAEVDSQAPSLL